MQEQEVARKLELCVGSFKKVLYEPDDIFLKNMEKNNLAGDDISKYQLWEWTQGVGLYGLWKLFERTKDGRYLATLREYYDARIADGLPGKNINTMAPVLALSYLYEYTGDETYGAVCKEWAQWVMDSLPKTKEGGFQHITSDTLNDGELWDDTLFMTVLVLANMGRILGRQDYTDEAVYQFLLHTKYLADKKTGLWYHGFTFHGNHNFAGAFWGRGNCWVTMRTISEEKRTKTDQCLLTAPVGLGSIVVGKFLAAFLIYIIAIAITGVFAVVVSAFGTPDWNVVVGNIVALALVGGAYIAIGIFCSSFTENQIVAAVISFIALIFVSFLSTIGNLLPFEWLTTVCEKVSFGERYYSFTYGLFDFSNVVFFLSAIVAFLFLTVRVLEKRRWG